MELIYKPKGQWVFIWGVNTGSCVQGQAYWGMRMPEFYKSGAARFHPKAGREQKQRVQLS